MLSLYHAGSEIPGWRKLLGEENVTHVALSYVGLRRRVKFARPWIIEEKYEPFQKIFLDSGAFTLNKLDSAVDDTEVMSLAEGYYEFAAANESRLEMVGEFDARQLGPDWLTNMRNTYAAHFGDKWVAMWHPEDGITELERLATIYKRVGVPQTSLGERDISPILNGLVRRYGTQLHGVGLTKVAPLYDIPFTTASSTSWISPSQYGDTFVWVSNTLKRYPKSEKQKARTRHYRLIQEAGFDAQKILDDSDSKEVLRLSLWAWAQLTLDVNRRRPEVVTQTPERPTTGNTQVTPDEVDNRGPRTHNPVIARAPSDRRLLPFLATTTKTITETGPDGERTERDVTLLGTSGRSSMNCNSCYVSQLCQAFIADAECAYDIPVELETKDQRAAVMDTLEKIQIRRIMIAAEMEQVNGGYVDPNVSSEIDRYAKFIKARAEAETNGFKLTIEASGRGTDGNMGMISRIFGRDQGESARALEAPQRTDHVLSGLGIVDAEVIENDPRYDA